MVTIQIYACYSEIATREIISNWNNCTVTPGTNEPQANNRNVQNQCIYHIDHHHCVARKTLIISNAESGKEWNMDKMA
jgi:hypothetical protein